MESARNREPRRIMAGAAVLAALTGIVLFLLGDRLPEWEPKVPVPPPVYRPYSGRVAGDPVDQVIVVRPTTSTSTVPVWDNPGV